jgi:hypothetical protein
MNNTGQDVRFKKLRTLGFILALTLAVSGGYLGSLGLSGTASADAFGQCNSNTGCEPDNKTHSGCWRYGGSIGSMRQEIWDFFWVALDSDTALSTTWNNSCSSSTDVRLDDDLTNPAFLGIYQCISFTGGECEQANITMNAGLLTNYCNYYATLCHELGHSAGLTHDTSNDCMTSGLQDGCNPPAWTYDAHHKAHISNDIN